MARELKEEKMREILFRGKRIDNGEFIEGHLYGLWDKKYILWGQTNHVPNGEEVIPETVGQFTGLTDKNGVKIFEGDILGFSLRHSLYGTVVYEHSGFEFVWDEETARVRHEISMQWIPTNLTMWEVIGNVYDNPELITAQKEET